MILPINFTNWITYDELLNNKLSYQELSDTFYEGAINAIVRELLDDDFVICGDTHQVWAVPVFGYNNYLMLSQRKWAEIMSDIMNLREHTKKYSYLDFYLASNCPIEEKIP